MDNRHRGIDGLLRIPPMLRLRSGLNRGAMLPSMLSGPCTEVPIQVHSGKQRERKGCSLVRLVNIGVIGVVVGAALAVGGAPAQSADNVQPEAEPDESDAVFGFDKLHKLGQVQPHL